MKTTLASKLRTSRRTHWPLRGDVAVWLIILNLVLFVAPGDVQADLVLNTNYPMDTNVCLGVTVKFQLGVSTTNYPLTFQWQREGTNLPGVTNSFLSLTNVTTADAGGYRALIWNAIGESTNSRTATLTVDTTFTKITQGPLVEDREGSVTGSWDDYDNDGRLDLIVANSGDTARQTLYRNLGGDEFMRVTNAITTRVGGAWGAQWADMDNDGDPDLILLYPSAVGGGQGRNAMFRNDGGGVFTSMTNTASTTAAYYTDFNWIDHNQDGWVDLYATTQTWTPGQSTNNYFFQNLGDGRFSAWTTNDVGMVLKPRSATAGPAWCDIDGDGDLDLYVCNYTGGAVNPGVTNYLYRNDGGRMVGVTAGSLPSRRSTYSSVWADFNNDGLFDLFTGGENATNTLHLNRGNWVFEDVTGASGLVLSGNVWNLAAGDFDNDGDLDLYVPFYDAADVLYVNRGDATFDRVNVGSPLTEGSRNSAIWVDYNNDGFLDLFEACGDGIATKNLLYRNNLPQSGNTNHWLKLRLKGTVSNASAIGARVWARAIIGGKQAWQVRQVGGGSLTANSDGFRVHFGLGDAAVVDLVRIEWPSGNVQELANQVPDRIVTLTEAVRINPVRPTASLGGNVTLTNVSIGTAYQWRFNGIDLVGETDRTLTLENLTAEDAGRYSAVVTLSNGTTQTNFTYLSIDPQFTKITTGPQVKDLGNSFTSSYGDYDQDGDLDLFVTRYKSGKCKLYQNNSDGTFVVGPDVFPTSDTWGSAIVADFDNDRWPDLFAGRENGSSAFRYNEKGQSFTAVDSLTLGTWWNASAVDYDKDGLLDLYFTWPSRLLRNLGSRAFEKMTVAQTGDLLRISTVGGACWGDYDDDGWIDVFAPGEGNLHYLFRNQAGRFTQVTNALTQATMASLAGAWGDYDNDGLLDLAIACFGGKSAVYRNLGDGNFADTPIGFTISGQYNSASWADCDNDGFLDLFMTYGNQGRNSLFRNNGDRTFTRITTGSVVADKPSDNGVSYNGLWFDANSDGFLDLYVPNGNDAGTAAAANFFYMNNTNSNHWLTVRLVGTTSNPQGIGAKVRARATLAGKLQWQRRDITAGDTFNGNQLYAHFGLGNATNVATLRIEWPSGTVQEFAKVAANQILTVTEPRRPVLTVTVTPTQVTGTLTGDTNTVYELQVSNDLDAGWTALTPVTTDANGKGNWTDAAVAPQGRRFYKAVKTP